jgi:hypothetical protein
VVVEVSYCTREDVKSALDIQTTARVNAQIDREIDSASRAIEGDLLRYFYPTVATQTFDWPGHQYETSWILRLGARELTSITQVLAAGVDITADCFLRPDAAPLRGFPFTKVEINLASNSAAFNSGSTFQRAISVSGTFGFCADETAGGTVTAFADTTGTTGTVSDGSLMGVGSILRVDSERMIVTGKNMANTGQTVTTSPTAQANTNSIGVSDGTQFDVDEVIMVDAEKMRIDDIAGNQLIVTRAWDGSVLAAHTSGTTVYASRLLTVERGVLGTTAATHSASAPVFVHIVPGLIRTLAVAETLNSLGQERRGYAQALKRGSTGDPSSDRDVSTGLDDIRKRAIAKYARVRLATTPRMV